MVSTVLTFLATWTAASMFATALWALAAGGTRQTETSLLSGWWTATVRRPGTVRPATVQRTTGHGRAAARR
jgi:hypothetical protein